MSEKETGKRGWHKKLQKELVNKIIVVTGGPGLGMTYKAFKIGEKK